MRILLSLALLAVVTTQSHANLVLTGIYDVSAGTPKGVELYVLNDIPDLSIYGIGIANDGGGSDGLEFSFPADSATQGDYIYVTTGLTAFQNFFGFAADYPGAVGVNGNDAVELYENGIVIDLFGEVTHGGSPSWDYAEGWAYRDDNTGPDGSTFVSSNWTIAVGALDGSTNAGSSTPMPIGTFQAVPEPSAFLFLALVGAVSSGMTSRKARSSARE